MVHHITKAPAAIWPPENVAGSEGTGGPRPVDSAYTLMTRQDNDSIWLILRHIDSYWDILTHIETYWLILNHIETYWDILTYIETSWLILRHIETFWLILRHLDLYWDILRHMETYWDQELVRINCSHTCQGPSFWCLEWVKHNSVHVMFFLADKIGPKSDTANSNTRKSMAVYFTQRGNMCNDIPFWHILAESLLRFFMFSWSPPSSTAMAIDGLSNSTLLVSANSFNPTGLHWPLACARKRLYNYQLQLMCHSLCLDHKLFMFNLHHT